MNQRLPFATIGAVQDGTVPAPTSDLVGFTPGPWRLGRVGDIGYSDNVAPCHIWTAAGPGRGMVATTAPWCEPGGQQHANARLIAAAPDLLAALKTLLQFNEELCADAGVSKHYPSAEKARAAIAKAEGRS